MTQLGLHSSSLLALIIAPALSALGCAQESGDPYPESPNQGTSAGGTATSSGASGGSSGSGTTTGGNAGTGGNTSVAGGTSSAGTSSSAGATSSGGSGGSGVIENPGVPGQSFDLGAWYLTLPTGVVGDPDDIYQPELTTFVSAPYFYVNSDGLLVFHANCGGVTTTGSQYPRSELRQMEADGITKSAWSTTVGVHTMETTLKITNTPVVKPDLVVNQIHDATDDIVLVRYTDGVLFVEGSVLDAMTGLPIKGESMTYATLEPAYVLGTEFSTKISAHDGQIDVYYNDMTTPAATLTTALDGLYFKAGVYTHSNPSKGDSPDAYGETQFSKIVVTTQ